MGPQESVAQILGCLEPRPSEGQALDREASHGLAHRPLVRNAVLLCILRAILCLMRAASGRERISHMGHNTGVTPVTGNTRTVQGFCLVEGATKYNKAHDVPSSRKPVSPGFRDRDATFWLLLCFVSLFKQKQQQKTQAVDSRSGCLLTPYLFHDSLQHICGETLTGRLRALSDLWFLWCHCPKDRNILSCL